MLWEEQEKYKQGEMLTEECEGGSSKQTAGKSFSSKGEGKVISWVVTVLIGFTVLHHYFIILTANL